MAKATSTSPNISPMRLAPTSPSADLQLQASVTIESLAERVATLESLLTERVLAIDDRLQVIEMTTREHAQDVSVKLRELNEQSHELSERLTELEVSIANHRAPRPEAYDVSTPQWTTRNRPTMAQEPRTRGADVTSQEVKQESVFRHLHGGFLTNVSETQGNPAGRHARDEWPAPQGFGIHSRGPAHQNNNLWASNSPSFSMSSSFGAGKSLHKEVTYIIDRKNTDGLTVFSGKIVDYERWVDKFVEHLSSSCARWRGVIDSLRKAQRPFDRQELIHQEMDGFNCWEVAIELGHFTFKYLHSDLYEDKWSLCGGPELNGFELWRNLEKRYGGTGKAVEVSGLATFMNFPGCNSEDNLVSHLARWEEYLNRYGSELRRTPETLRVMILQVLPKDMADKLRLKRDKYPTFQSILAYVRDRHEERREVAKAEAFHQSRRSNRVSTMMEEQGQATYAAVAARTQPKQQVRQQVPVAPTMEDLQNMVAAVSGLRQKPNSPAPNAFKKFIFRGCWECGKEGHSRHQCEAWKKVLDKDGKPPPGHKGAKDRAWAKWKADKAAAQKRDRINLLGQEATGDNTEDEDNGDEYDEFGMRRICMLMDNPVPISNTFSALANDDSDHSESDDVAEAMNHFAHSVQVGKKPSQKSRRPKEDFTAVLKEMGHRSCEDRKRVIVRCPEDLERSDVQKIIRPLPESTEQINRIAALAPSSAEVPLEPGEQWILFDTGASCNALNVQRDCPLYIDDVKPTKNSMTGKGAESASGSSIKERGEVLVDMLVDGSPCQIAFKDMDVSMPISSGRACVGGGDTFAIIHRNGGCLKNIATGKEVRLYARQGVYFFKASILPPQSLAPDESSPFVRRG